MRGSIKRAFKGIVKSVGKSTSGFFVHAHSLFGISNKNMFKSRAYASITVIANRTSGLGWHLEDSKGKTITHKHMDLITPEILKYIAISLKMYGETYIYKMKTESGKLLSLEYINKHAIAPKISGGYQVGWTLFGKTIPFDDIIVFRDANPFNTYGQYKTGYSPLMAAQSSMNNEYNMETWNSSLMDNGAMPGLQIKLASKPSKEELARLKEEIDNQYGNVKNRGKVFLLPEGMSLETAGMLTQKDMEFVEGMKWTMEKILAIFQVPKAMLGMGEGVNVGNVKAFEDIFARNVIQPLTVIISDTLSKRLFDGVKMIFDGVVPRDEDSIRANYYTGAITRNEMRVALGYDPVKGGDMFYDGDDGVVEYKKQSDSKVNEQITKAVSKGFLSLQKGTEEYNEKRRENAVKRQDDFLPEIEKVLKKIFAQQEKDILSKIKDEKSLKSSTPSLGDRFRLLYIKLLTNPFELFMKSEGQIAMDEVDSDQIFDAGTAELKKMRKSQIVTMARSVDKLTDEKMAKVMAQATSQGLTPAEVKKEIKKVFKELSSSRLNTIVRTETTRLATSSQAYARDQSGVVESKERYTALDERVSPMCKPMHGKVINIKENYFDKGDVVIDTNGKPHKLSYGDTFGPPLHPNCRCTLLPVLKKVEDI